MNAAEQRLWKGNVATLSLGETLRLVARLSIQLAIVNRRLGRLLMHRK